MSEIDLQRQIDELRRTIASAESRDASMIAYQSYTPTWGGTVTNPVLNDGTLVSRYITRGRSCLWVVKLTMGAGTTYGSGNWSFSLPVTAANNGADYLGVAYANDNNTGARYTFIAIVTAGGTTLSAFTPTTAGTTAGTLTSAVPITWAASDVLRIQVEYEI